MPLQSEYFSIHNDYCIKSFRHKSAPDAYFLRSLDNYFLQLSIFRITFAAIRNIQDENILPLVPLYGIKAGKVFIFRFHPRERFLYNSVLQIEEKKPLGHNMQLIFRIKSVSYASTGRSNSALCAVIYNTALCPKQYGSPEATL